jgi:hypothetical protein
MVVALLLGVLFRNGRFLKNRRVDVDMMNALLRCLLVK